MLLRRVLFFSICALVLASAVLLPGARQVLAAPLTGVAAVSAGPGYTCALTTGGGVKCWGNNGYGALGNGTSSGPQNCVPNRLDPCSVTPVDVSGLTGGVVGVSAGGDRTCAVTTGGGVRCWGLNAYGELGNGSTTNSSAPVDVTGLTSDAVGVSASAFYHTCALTTAGGVKCWGQNTFGQLGSGTSTGPQSCNAFGELSACSMVPLEVTGLTSGVSAVSAGGRHTCAMTTAGGLKCWGYNGDGELGNGTTTDSSTPVDVTGLTSGVAAVSAGESDTCALTTVGGVKCWGLNSTGELGDGTGTNRTTPVDVSGLTSGVAAVSPTDTDTCAVTAAGGVKCWGEDFGPTPVDVSGLTSGVAAVSAGIDHTCALTTVGGVRCLGYNGSGGLGDGTTTDRTMPVDVVATPPYPVGDVSCDVAINAIDAVFVLQLSAQLVFSLPCSQNGDANRDDTVNAVDAVLILQYGAGLINSLPP